MVPAYADVLPDAWQDYLLLLEAGASRVLIYEAQRIPAFSQTVNYARALAEADPALADDDARDRVVEGTRARQKKVLGERKSDIHVVIGGGAHAAACVGSLAVLQFLEAPALGVVHLGGAARARSARRPCSAKATPRQAKTRARGVRYRCVELRPATTAAGGRRRPSGTAR
jgi:Domain of unknown function (DUF5753)